MARENRVRHLLLQRQGIFQIQLTNQQVSSIQYPASMKKLNRTTTRIAQNRPVKVLQFGEGNFLRAFVDWTIDILNEKTDFNGAVEIIQPISKGMAAMVNDQDGLYHVVLNGIQNGKTVSDTRLITCV